MSKITTGASALFLSTFVLANVALAGDCVTKVLDQNDKLRTLDHLCQPGDSAPMAKRGARAFYLVEGGALERTYEDGTKEVLNYQTGDSRVLVDDKAFSYKNVGTTPIHFFIVYPK